MVFYRKRRGQARRRANIRRNQKNRRFIKKRGGLRTKYSKNLRRMIDYPQQFKMTHYFTDKSYTGNDVAYDPAGARKYGTALLTNPAVSELHSSWLIQNLNFIDSFVQVGTKTYKNHEAAGKTSTLQDTTIAGWAYPHTYGTPTLPNYDPSMSLVCSRFMNSPVANDTKKIQLASYDMALSGRPLQGQESVNLRPNVIMANINIDLGLRSASCNSGLVVSVQVLRWVPTPLPAEHLDQAMVRMLANSAGAQNPAPRSFDVIANRKIFLPACQNTARKWTPVKMNIKCNYLQTTIQKLNTSHLAEDLGRGYANTFQNSGTTFNRIFLLITARNSTSQVPVKVLSTIEATKVTKDTTSNVIATKQIEYHDRVTPGASNADSGGPYPSGKPQLWIAGKTQVTFKCRALHRLPQGQDNSNPSGQEGNPNGFTPAGTPLAEDSGSESE